MHSGIALGRRRSGSHSIAYLATLFFGLLHPWVRCAAQRCDLTAFQGNASSPPRAAGAACPTCVFPLYQRVKGINGSALLGLDLTNQWVYFYGDSTTHQLHEQFLDYMDSSSQVRC